MSEEDIVKMSNTQTDYEYLYVVTWKGRDSSQLN